MLTGHTPFSADSVEQIIDMHLHQVPDDPRNREPGISAELSALVMKCLEKDPAARYQTAEDLGQALGCLRAFTPGRAIRDWISKHKPASIDIGLAAAGLIGYGAYALYEWLFVPKPLPTMSTLAVLRPSDTSAENAGLLAHFQDSLSVKLGGIQGIVVLSPRTVHSIETANKNARQIGRSLRADYLVEPRCRIEGDKITFFLIFGVSGTGKTMIAKALATQANVPIIPVKATSLIGEFVGEGARQIYNLYERAEQIAPCIIFIDELDAIALDRHYQDLRGDVSEIVKSLLTEMDGIHNRTGVCTIAATNKIEFIDNSIRSGFEEEIEFKLPNEAERLRILEQNVLTHPVETEGVDLREIAGLRRAFLAEIW